MILEANRLLAPLTTFRIGGPARWFAEAASEEDVADASRWAHGRGWPLFVLGSGSNLLVSDGGFNGMVLRVSLKGIQTKNGASQTVYHVAAGEDWDHFVQRSVEDNCAGLECLAGIPGTVGGTPVQNVGAYGQEVAASIERVRAFDLTDHEFVELTAAECGFGYRRSRFNTSDRERYIVTRVDFKLTQGGTPTLRYADLQRAFPAGSDTSLVDVAAAVRRIRHSKGMLLVEGDSDCRSAGSFFKNPVLTREKANRVAIACGKMPPQFPAGSDPENADQVKIPAAWLIEQAGFDKGYVRGAAGVSSRHTLALINRGGATAAEILALAEEIASAVEVRFGIHLEMEPVLVGFTSSE
jgi:UDP-N-acetylmuramate dehydrogenase